MASPLTILTSADIHLARAEAAEIGWTEEDADAQYYQGIADSWAHWGLDDASFDTFIAQPEIDLSAGSRLEKIGTQRWLTFFPNAVQGYAEYRRTGFPDLQPAPVPVNASKQIPIRYIYPTVEYGLNTTGINAAIAKLDKGDTYDSHIWWNQ